MINEQFARKIYFLCELPAFNRFILFLILLNTIFLAMEHHGMSDTLAYFLEIANIMLTSLFALEMLLKIIGYSLRGYLSDVFNVFDAIIVIISVTELFVSTSAASGVTALRTLRLLRVFKMIKSVESLRVLMTTILGSISGILYMCALMSIFIFIFAVLGMQLFAGKLNLSTNRWNFDNIGAACITVFQVWCFFFVCLLCDCDFAEVVLDTLERKHIPFFFCNDFAIAILFHKLVTIF